MAGSLIAAKGTRRFAAALVAGAALMGTIQGAFFILYFDILWRSFHLFRRLFGCLVTCRIVFTSFYHGFSGKIGKIFTERTEISTAHLTINNQPIQ